MQIWNHPDVLYNFLKKKGEEIDLDLEEALPPSMQPPGFPYGQHQQENPATQFNQVQPVPQPWPKRGPGSRGGKIRQIGRPRVSLACMCHGNKQKFPLGRTVFSRVFAPL